MREFFAFWQNLAQLHLFGRICLAVSCILSILLLVLCWWATTYPHQSPQQILAALCLARGCREAVPALLVAGTASALLADYLLREKQPI